MTNLISNAYRYGKENGHILVRLHSNDTGASERRSLSLSVGDDGIGISKEEQKYIFQRFYQVDPSRSGAGTGLGLSMVQQIAEFHNGTVTVKSAPGDGSIFTVLMFLYSFCSMLLLQTKQARRTAIYSSRQKGDLYVTDQTVF